MALSKREQEVLHDLEEQFLATEPDFAQTLSKGPTVGARMRYSARAVGAGVALILTGFALIIGGVALHRTLPSMVLGVIGFGVTVYGITLILGAAMPGKPDSDRHAHGPHGPRSSSQRGLRGSFMDKQAQRWEERRNKRS